MKKNLIVGANSAIAEETARLLATRGDQFYLLGRSAERLKTLADDLKIRGAANVGFAVFDANDFPEHELAIAAAVAAMDGIDIALIAHGTLGDQKASERDVALTLRELNTNAISVISLLTLLANYFEARRQGTIAVIGSVAGDRGRQSNYVYGTAKAAVSVFLQGLRNRLFAVGVSVVTIKPGFVDTPMTRDFKKGLLWASPRKIASGIVQAIDKRASIVYLPGFWRYLMLIIRLVPESIFRRLKL
jgi:decaprenylphospho-beta-D-erythro-pentofuranosid-2-ulose 2-reductase